MRMREFFNALVDRVSRANTKNKNRSYERPEEPFLPVTKRMFTRCRTFVEPQTQQQKDLVHRIGDRVERLGHHARRASDNGCRQLQYRDQCIGKERADYGQHTTILRLRVYHPQITQITQIM